MSTQIATFAGGCFWCLQHDFDQTLGVLSTLVGYTGGVTTHPTYQEVCRGTTGHVEALQITFDPSTISYQNLLDLYWHSIDPTRSDGQFCDTGPQYKPVIFYHDEEQRRLAEVSKEALIQRGLLVKVSILPEASFYHAEAYHQKYYEKSSDQYNVYARGREGKKLSKTFGSPNLGSGLAFWHLQKYFTIKIGLWA